MLLPRRVTIVVVIITLPKTNSSPLKIGRAPKGNDRIPTIHFQVRTGSFREGIHPQSLRWTLKRDLCFNHHIWRIIQHHFKHKSAGAIQVKSRYDMQLCTYKMRLTNTQGSHCKLLIKNDSFSSCHLKSACENRMPDPTSCLSATWL